MSESMIVLAKIQFSDGEQVRTLGVSDSPYFGDASGLEGGCWWPILDTEADTRWGESGRHPFQGQPQPFRVGDLALVYVPEILREWPDYQIASLITETQRGPRHTVWNEEPDRWDVHHPGKQEPVWRAQGRTRRFEGNTRLVLSYESILTRLSGALNREVFDENTPNENLINRTAPMILGNVYQMRPLMTRPQTRTFFVAWNQDEVMQAQEGGNPTDGWVPHEQGLTLTREALLPITCHAKGPPPLDPTETDLLASIGGFDAWTSGQPDGWTTYEDPPDAEISEDADGALVAIAGDVAVDSTSANASDIRRLYSSGSWGWGLRNPDSFFGGWDGGPEVAVALSEDQDPEQYLRAPIGGGNTTTRPLRFRDWGLSISEVAQITGVEVKVRAKKEIATGVTFDSVVLQLPDGSLSDNRAGDEAVSETKTLHTFGGDVDRWGLGTISAEDANNANFGAIIQFRSAPTGTFSVEVQVHEVEIVIHTGDLSKTVRLYVDAGMVPGREYRLEITTLGTDSLGARWAGVDAIGDPVVEAPSPFSEFSRTLDGGTLTVSEFTPSGGVFAIEFFKGSTDGTNIVRQIALWQKPAVDRYPEIVDYIFEHVGLAPSIYVRQSMIEAHALATGNPALGLIIAGSETGDDVLFKCSGSLNGLGPWDDRAGRYASQLFQPPGESDDVLVLDKSRISQDVEIWDDDPPNTTDRVKAARNWFPLREGNTAEITTTFTEQAREDVITDHRVTRRAKFPELEGYPAPVGWSVESISPTSGDEAGGTEYTITGTGFRPGDPVTVLFGEAEDETATVDNSTTISGTTPAGTGTVDVTVTQGEDSDTLVGEFEYTEPAETIVKLTGSGDWEVPEGVTELKEVLLVAGGGGGGGNSRGGGGGGAGEVKLLQNVAVTPGEFISYSVGAGGDGGLDDGTPGTNGAGTSFGADSAIGGGYGGTTVGGSVGDGRDGNDGASGGGGSAIQRSVNTSTHGGTGLSGNNGGRGSNSGTSGDRCGGGGGGAGATGADGTFSKAGDGGVGVDHSAIFGVTYGDEGWFGGGGGGGKNITGTKGDGGKGGGGSGAVDDGSQLTPGAAETGGGGGGQGGAAAAGAAGGSGIILIRY